MFRFSSQEHLGAFLMAPAWEPKCVGPFWPCNATANFLSCCSLQGATLLVTLRCQPSSCLSMAGPPPPEIFFSNFFTPFLGVSSWVLKKIHPNFFSPIFLQWAVGEARSNTMLPSTLVFLPKQRIVWKPYQEDTESKQPRTVFETREKRTRRVGIRKSSGFSVWMTKSSY